MLETVESDIASPLLAGYSDTALRVTFIDHSNFVRLQSMHFTLEDFPKLIHEGKKTDKLSVMSQAYLSQLNVFLSEVVLGQLIALPTPAQSEKEKQYTLYSVTSDLLCPGYVEVASSDTQKLCYDTLPVDSRSLVVVVQQGFLNHLANNKDSYTQFVLDCIRCMDRFNCDTSQLNKLYLNIRLTGAPYELLRCRIQ